MIERLVENWLTNVNELGYQVPFCHALGSAGFEIIHISRHGRGEHGKDIVARDPGGHLHTFQLKGGDINLSDWRNIRGEVEELVRLPVRHPGVDENEPHQPVLVTNGVLVGDAIENVRRFTNEWSRLGAPTLDVWTKNQVLGRFLDAHGAFLPTEMGDFRAFVELYVRDHRDRIPRAQLAAFLLDVAEQHALEARRTATIRALNSIALLGGYIIEQYERNENWISAVEGWTILASTILFVAESLDLPTPAYEGALSLALFALTRNLDHLEAEVFERDSLVEARHILAEPLVHGTRTATVLAWLCASALLRKSQGRDVDRVRIRSALRTHLPHLKVLGECDWPKVIAIGLYLDRAGTASEADWLFNLWVAILRQQDRKRTDTGGLPSPYWLEDRIIQSLAGELPPYETENFVGNSYTTLAVLDALVRRLCRQQVAAAWPWVSRIHYCQFVPESHADLFRWSCDRGKTVVMDPVPTVSWSAWRDEAARLNENEVPMGFRRHPNWLLPFLLTYPHRANRTMCKLADALVGQRVYYPSKRE